MYCILLHLRIEVNVFVCIRKLKDTGHVYNPEKRESLALFIDLQAIRIPSFPNAKTKVH